MTAGRIRRAAVAVVEVLLAVGLAVVAVELWRGGGAPHEPGPVDGRWWAGAVTVATLAGILLLDVVRRTATSAPTAGQADWEP